MEHMQSDELLLFSTDYPHWQFDGMAALPDGLSPELVRKIMVENPRATYARLLEPVSMNVQRHTLPLKRPQPPAGWRSPIAISIPPGVAGMIFDPWLPARWREHLADVRRPAGARAWRRARPTRRASRMPPAATPIRPKAAARAAASSFMQAQHLDANNVVLGILNPLNSGPGRANPELERRAVPRGE